MHPIPKNRSVTSSTFGLTIQGLVLLSISNKISPSQELTKMMNTATTFLRRMIRPLVRANLVKSGNAETGAICSWQP